MTHAAAHPRISRGSIAPVCSRVRVVALAACAAWLATPALPAAGMLSSQDSAATAPAQAPAHPHSRAKTKPSAGTPAAQTAAPAPVEQTPALPDWPANDKPSPATVVWDSRGLRIDAGNSSLQQILKDVSADTGARVEGLRSDERIFGTYGPGPARDVLSQLLDGTGYNVVMIGDQGQGTPRQINLSAQPTGPAPANSGQNAGSEEDYEAEQPEAQPLEMPTIRNDFRPPVPPPGAPPRTPQEIIQQMRQEQLQQQQQQQQQQQEQNNQQK